MEQYYSTGRRKTSVARVFLRPGTGKILVNKHDVNEYFKRDIYIHQIKHPFDVTNSLDKFDVYATVKGGGTTGQAEALVHGIARALLVSNEELRKDLRQANLLTRDSRITERKKYGQRGARAKFQFSKR